MSRSARERVDEACVIMINAVTYDKDNPPPKGHIPTVHLPCTREEFMDEMTGKNWFRPKAP